MGHKAAMDIYEAPQSIANQLMIEVFSNLRAWALPSAASYRNAALGYAGRSGKSISGLMVNPMLAIAEVDEADSLMKTMADTIRRGCMLDFGFIPNDIIKRDSIRFRDSFEAGEFTHPYDQWVAVARWEGGMCGYFVMTGPDNITTVVAETYGVRVPEQPSGVPAHDSILIHDVISIRTDGPGRTDIRCFPMHPKADSMAQDLRGANSLDPLVCFLALLANAAVPVHHIAAPEKLNKNRLKLGKSPIPMHTRVETEGYVTYVQKYGTARPRREHQGGTHASPVMHPRRAHDRRLASGVVTPVRATRVNWREAEDVQRMFYRMRERP